MRGDAGRRAAEVMLMLEARGVTSVGDKVIAAAREEFGDGVAPHAMRHARRVLMCDRRLLERVRDGEISLYLAFEMATRGLRETCPTCGGVGHVFKPLTSVRRRRRRSGVEG